MVDGHSITFFSIVINQGCHEVVKIKDRTRCQEKVNKPRGRHFFRWKNLFSRTFAPPPNINATNTIMYYKAHTVQCSGRTEDGMFVVFGQFLWQTCSLCSMQRHLFPFQFCLLTPALGYQNNTHTHTRTHTHISNETLYQRGAKIKDMDFKILLESLKPK